jgi:tRNA-methyltransferase O
MAMSLTVAGTPWLFNYRWEQAHWLCRVDFGTVKVDEHRVDADIFLLGTLPSDNRPHGVCATRSRRRPNSIGLTVVELRRREGSLLHVRGIDMLDGTPVLDIKSYLSNVSPEVLRRGRRNPKGVEGSDSRFPEPSMPIRTNLEASSLVNSRIRIARHRCGKLKSSFPLLRLGIGR